MAEADAPAEVFSGSALDDAVEVLVDERGHVISVRVDARVLPRLWPEQLGRAVVLAHAEAVAATMTERR